MATNTEEIETTADGKHGEFAMVPLSRIQRSPNNPRRFENMSPRRAAAFRELVNSIRQHGIIEPLVVRRLDGDDSFGYRLLAGERRHRASETICEEDGTSPATIQIPVMIRTTGQGEGFGITTAENDNREDLTPRERAEGYARYLKDHGDTPEALTELSHQASISPAAIRRSVRLLELPAEVLDEWDRGTITAAHVEEFTRVPDRTEILKLLTVTLRDRLTVKELGEKIEQDRPPLSTAKFDTIPCNLCVNNGGIQSGLFRVPDSSDAKCLDTPCFEEQQAAFFTAAWPGSKARETFKTQGYRFAHRIKTTERELVPETVKERCETCPEFVSVVRLTGVLVKGQERVCCGPRPCWTELYQPPKKTKTAGDTGKTGTTGKGGKGAKGAKAKKTAGGKGAAADAKKRDAERARRRGETFREKHLYKAIPAAVEKLDPRSPETARIALLGLLLASEDARTAFTKGEFSGDKANRPAAKETWVKTVYALPEELVYQALRQCSVAPIMGSGGSWNAVSSPEVRRSLAPHVGIDLAGEWSISREYLESMTKAEIIGVLEEPGLNVWSSEEVREYLDKHHKGKALASLKHGDLVNVVMKSGLTLQGRTPTEIVSTTAG